MKTSYIFIALIFCGHMLKAQYSISGAVKDSLNNPVPFANVYLSNTTIGTSTDKDGKYSLPNVVPGSYELSASCLGYTSFSKSILMIDKPLSFNLKLRAKPTSIDEIQITSSKVQPFTDFNLFEKLFLGESIYAQGCTIKNKKDLKLYLISQKNLIRGHSATPLLIENKALGFLLTYDLTDFYYDKTTEILKYKGSAFFQPLEGSKKKIINWETNRKKAYKNSKIYFLRAILSDSTFQKSFKLFHFKKDPKTNENKVQDQFQIAAIRLDQNRDWQTFYYNQPVVIRYEEKEPDGDKYFSFSGMNNSSLISFSDTIKVYSNGIIENPNSITWSGKMMNERVGDLLPIDYNPDANLVSEKNATKLFNSSIGNSKSFTGNLPEEQVFVQTDRNSYQAGDTIYFQAYIRNRFTGEFRSSSSVLYALIFNPEFKQVDSARFKISQSLATGWLKVPSNAKPGRYRIVSFTSKMQDYDPSEVFKIDINVGSTVKDQYKYQVSFSKKEYQLLDTVEATIIIKDTGGNPVSRQKINCSLRSGNNTLDSDKIQTNQQGETTVRFVLPKETIIKPQILLDIKTGKSEDVLEKKFAIPWKPIKLNLDFLPEGGNLIDGIPQRIGFHATNDKGETFFIKGLLKTREGVILDTIRSGKFGPGIFICTPREGMYVEVLQENNKNLIFPLPPLYMTGICLRVTTVNKHIIAVELNSNKSEPEQLHIEGSIQWNKVISKDLILDKKQSLLIKTDDLPSGILEITVYDKSNQPLATRFCMVNSQKKLHFQLSVDSISNDANGVTELQISASDESGHMQSGLFSIAVVDSLMGFDNSCLMPDISFTFLDHPYLKKNLPILALEKGFSNLPLPEQDLLLMIFGWKKYHLPDQNFESFENSPYDFLKIHLLYSLKSKRKDRVVNLYSMEGPSMIPFKTNTEGNIIIPLDSLPKETCTVSVMPDFKAKNRIQGAQIIIPNNPEFFKNESLYEDLPFLPETINTSKEQEDTTLTFQEKTVHISKVTITGRKKSEKKARNEYLTTYGYSNIRELEYNEIQTSFNFEDALRKLVTFKLTSIGVVIRQGRSITKGEQVALIVLDDQPLFYDGFNIVNSINPSEIQSITCLNSSAGFTRYGEAAAGGVIFVNTKARNPSYYIAKSLGKNQNSKDRLMAPISIYRPAIEYYNPQKTEVDSLISYQHLPTVYWAPKIFLNENNPVKIIFPNNKHTGTMRIFGNGISSSSLMGSFSLKYQTKNL